MGAVSSCCAVEESADKQAVSTSDAPKGNTTTSGGAAAAAKPHGGKRKSGGDVKGGGVGGHVADEGELKHLQELLEAGMDVFVLLQDGTKLSCVLTYSSPEESLSISCEDKVRVIPISDIKSLLSTREQLKRVETKADLTDDPNCVAMHLAESGNCIPIRFAQSESKLLFLQFIKKVQKKGK
eukprot:GHVS01002493.1.p1 GENE.GHVS01002493.1~~GHVS01002493.1.p1  ORF type:complete len:182 (+),score=39.83 GHVS01002493.1:199-744(+)